MEKFIFSNQLNFNHCSKYKKESIGAWRYGKCLEEFLWVDILYIKYNIWHTLYKIETIYQQFSFGFHVAIKVGDWHQDKLLWKIFRIIGSDFEWNFKYLINISKKFVPIIQSTNSNLLRFFTIYYRFLILIGNPLKSTVRIIK
jgi:hypothetical protein